MTCEAGCHPGTLKTRLLASYFHRFFTLFLPYVELISSSLDLRASGGCWLAHTLSRKAAPCTRALQISSCPHACSLAAANNQHPGECTQSILLLSSSSLSLLSLLSFNAARRLVGSRSAPDYGEIVIHILHGISPLPVSLSASEDSSHTLSINYRLERAHVVRSKGQQERPSVCVHSQTHAQGPPAPFNMLWAASFSLSISLFLLSVSLCSNDGWFPVAVSYRFSTHLCSKTWVCVCCGNNIRQNWLVTLWSLLRFSLYWRRLFRWYICKCCSTQLNYQGNYEKYIYI